MTNMIGRFTTNFCKCEEFEKIILIYENTLKSSGYKKKKLHNHIQKQMIKKILEKGKSFGLIHHLTKESLQIFKKMFFYF